MRRTEWTDALLDGLFNGTIESSEVSLVDLQFLTRYPVPSVARRATKYFESRKLLPDPDRARVLAQFVPALDGTPDLRAGARAFDLHCAQCHRLQDRGQEFGPRLSNAFQRDPLDLLAAASYPKLVVSGGWSPAFDAVCDVLVERLGAERAVVPGAGHNPQLADGFNERLLAFLTSPGSRSRP